MRVTKFTKSCLRFRRQRRDLEKEGYKLHEPIRDIAGYNEKIVDVKISTCGSRLYIKKEKVSL